MKVIIIFSVVLAVCWAGGPVRLGLGSKSMYYEYILNVNELCTIKNKLLTISLAQNSFMIIHVFTVQILIKNWRCLVDNIKLIIYVMQLYFF